MCERAQDRVLTARHTKWQGQRVDYSCIISLTCERFWLFWCALHLWNLSTGLSSTAIASAACCILLYATGTRGLDKSDMYFLFFKTIND